MPSLQRFHTPSYTKLYIPSSIAGLGKPRKEVAFKEQLLIPIAILRPCPRTSRPILISGLSGCRPRQAA